MVVSFFKECHPSTLRRNWFRDQQCSQEEVNQDILP